MGVRTFDRIPLLMNATITSNTNVYKGMVTNLSEKGLFIRTDLIQHQLDPQIEITITVGNSSICLSGKPVRIENIRGYCTGIGVEVVNPPQSYLDLFENLLTVL